MSASTTLTSCKSSNTTGTTFQIAAKAVVHTKTDLEPTLSRQHEVAMAEVTDDRLSSADQTKTKLLNCAVQVFVKTTNKCVNAHQELVLFTLYRNAKLQDPNRQVTHFIKQIILAKLRYINYARSNVVGARLGEEEQAVIA